MRFYITIEGKTYPPTRLFESQWTQYHCNRLYFCGVCGRTWATWEIEADSEATHLTIEWHATRRACPDHVFGTWEKDVPGAIGDCDQDTLLLPRELLKRELLLLTARPVADETSLTSEDPTHGQV